MALIENHGGIAVTTTVVTGLVDIIGKTCKTQVTGSSLDDARLYSDAQACAWALVPRADAHPALSPSTAAWDDSRMHHEHSGHVHYIFGRVRVVDV